MTALRRQGLGRLRGRVLKLPPNRVWRTYQGGRNLDVLAGLADPRDSHFPEDWIASVTRAVNPGRDAPDEGISKVRDGDTGALLSDLIAEDPEYFLGPEHVRVFGPDPRVLVKFLDPSIRLHLQVHPTAAFAKAHFGSPSGKAEAYHILDVRAECKDPHVFIGFRREVSREQLRGWILRQDIETLKDTMHRIAVCPGDTLFVPGGCPHALGAGILLVEVQEPTDWVVRFEFERGGYTLPEEARFMGRGLDFCLDVFDRKPLAPDRLRTLAMPEPQTISADREDAWSRERLIGTGTTPCFRMDRLHLRWAATLANDGFHIGIVTQGKIEVAAGDNTITLERFGKYLVPAGVRDFRIHPVNGPAAVLECRPPAP